MSEATTHVSAGLRWSALSAAGLTIGIGLGLLLASPAEAVLGVMFVLPVVGGAAGLILGGAQLVAGLRERVSPVRWTLATSVGVAVGLTLGTVLVETVLVDAFGLRGGEPLSDLAALTLVGGLTGAAAGLVQWPFLAGEGTSPDGGWVVGSAAGLAAGAVVGGGLCYLVAGTIRSPLAILVVALAGGAALGAVLGRRRPARARAESAPED